MEQKLAKRRIVAEHAFNEILELKGHVDTKLKELGVSSYSELETELARLQGEYRLVDDLLKEVKPTKAKVSPKADVVDVEGATSG